ncbi:MAG: immunoglobulin-like domain-containing protein [Bacteroidota bacterium]
MKSILFSTLIVLFLSSCNKDSESSPPIISLNGSNEVTVSLQGQYSEQGATASDQEDGDISSSIIISGAVNTQFADLYRIYYDVVDSDGNKAVQVIRNVKVRNDADYLDGFYDVNYLSNPTTGDGFRIDELKSSKTVNNKVYISGENTGFHISLNASAINVFKDNISIGTGNVVSSSNFILNYVFDQITYQDTYTKQ